MKINKIRLFSVLVITHALFAFGIFLNEVRAMYVFGENFPIEHRASWVVVILFGGGAVCSCCLLLLLTSNKKWTSFLPSPVMVLSLATFPTLLSTVSSHYLSMIGWCCEHPLAFYFGFPFSFLLGIGGYQYDVIAPYQNDGLLKILFTSQPQVSWRFLPYQFFLDFLFWFNIILILLSLLAWVRKKENLFELPKEEVQSETV